MTTDAQDPADTLRQPPTLDEFLTLAGRLDDEGGFDSARERFRRFLREYSRHPGIVRVLVEQCQHVPGEQHQRALADLVTVLGLPFGFDVSFGSYGAPDSVARFPVWRSRSIEFVLDVRTARAAPARLHDDDHRLPARGLSLASASAARTLLIHTPLAAHAGSGAETPAAIASSGAVAVGTLLSLADLIRTRRLTHDEIVRLLADGRSTDFVVTLLERPVPAPSVTPPLVSEDALPAADARNAMFAGAEANSLGAGPAHWIVTVGRDDGLPPEQFLQIVVGRRFLFGVPNDGALSALRAGDRLCFHVSGKGIVGRAAIRSIDATTGGLRDARRFRHVLQLTGVVLTLDEPVPLDSEAALRVRAIGGRGIQTHTFVRIPADQFARLIADPADRPLDGREPPAPRADPPTLPDVAVSAGSSE